MNTDILTTITSLDVTTITEERKQVLQPLIDFIKGKHTTNEEIRLNFICTHNSRRSHLSQVWAQAMAFHFNIKNVFCYSGGTEATAMFHMSAKALMISGFDVTTISEGNNPVYTIKYNVDKHPLICFSKTFDDAFNPQHDFAAIMTCSSADEGCPFIAGATVRVPVTYEDPKAFDNTPQQEEKYVERSLQIATEMKFVFSQIK